MQGMRLYDAVANRIERLIDQEAYTPGTRLPSERALAEQFEVSRVTVREALISLQTLGRVKIRTGSGVYVANGSAVHVMPEASAFELTQARLLFESEAAALAAPDISDATLAHLRELLERMQSSQSDEEADQADREFHVAIAAATENQVVRQVVESFWRMRMEQAAIRDVYSAVCSHDAAMRGEEHGEILEALEARDAEAARCAMRKHFRRLLESMLEATEEQALQEVKRRAAETRQRYLKGAV